MEGGRDKEERWGWERGMGERGWERGWEKGWERGWERRDGRGGVGRGRRGREDGVKEDWKVWNELHSKYVCVCFVCSIQKCAYPI